MSTSPSCAVLRHGRGVGEFKDTAAARRSGKVEVHLEASIIIMRAVLGLRDLVQPLRDLRREGLGKTTSVAQRRLVGPARADVQRLDVEELRVPQRQAQTLEAREVALT